MELRKIIISLDALLDFRQGVYAYLTDAKKAFELTSQPEYFQRKRYTLDTPDGDITQEEIKQICANYPRQVLTNSVRTKILSFVKYHAQNYRNLSVTSPINFGIRICVNIHGFALTSQERFHIETIVQDLCEEPYPVQTIDMSPAELNIAYVKNNVACIITYDAQHWIDLHTKTIMANAPNPEFQLFIPRLFHGDSNNPELKQELKQVKQDYFQAYQVMLQAALQVAFLPVCLFSADVPANKNEYCSI